MQHISDLTTALTANATTTAKPATNVSGWTPNLDPYEPSLAHASGHCARFVEAMERGAPPYWLTLTGINGCGKTMLARQVFAQAKRVNPGNPANNRIWPPNWATSGEKTHAPSRPYCLWFDERDFASRIRGGEYDLPEQTRTDFLVVVDELGATRDPTNFVSEAMGRLCEARLGGWAIFCTNLSQNEIRDRIDARVASRLIRDGHKFVEIKAGDYALRKRRAA